MKLYRLSEEQYYMDSPTSLYLFSSHTIEELKKYNLICFGVGIMMQLAKLELKKMDLSFMGYADNDPGKQGKKVGKVEVVQPSYYFGKQVHFVICVKEHSLNAVRVQLEANGIHDYSICCETFDYIDSDNTFNQLTQKSAEQIAEHYSMPIKPYYYKGRPLAQIWYSICSVRFWHPAAKWLLSSIDDEDEVLEIGAGGMLSNIIRNANKSVKIDWLNYGESDSWGNSEMFDEISDHRRLGELYYGYIENVNEPLKRLYSKIIMTEVLEHFICNPVPALKKIKQYLKPGGLLYLTTPNWGHMCIYDSYKDMPVFSTMEEYERYNLNDGEHTYQYSKMELEELVKEAGYEILAYEESVGRNHNLCLKVK